jgi:hypothetical protein
VIDDDDYYYYYDDDDDDTVTFRTPGVMITILMADKTRCLLKVKNAWN